MTSNHTPEQLANALLVADGAEGDEVAALHILAAEVRRLAARLMAGMDKGFEEEADWLEAKWRANYAHRRDQ